MTKPRVLVVDDSAFARTVISRLLRDAGIEVIGTAHDGAEALERIEADDPDLVTLDLTMPGLDGLGVLRALQGRPRPRVIIVSVSSIDTENGAEALALGAIDLVAKPLALANDRLLEIGAELVTKVYAATATAPRELPPPSRPLRPGHRARLVMIGTSTGGPQALTRVLSALPADLAAPVAVVLHIPGGYTEALANRLDKASKLHVVEARDGMKLERGLIVIAPGGLNLRVEDSGGGLQARVSALPMTPFKPSVNELFTSGAIAVRDAALGVVLTGMGDDGLIGARAIAQAGGSLLTESAASCVVYGMPRSVFEANLGARQVSLDVMAEEIAKYV